MSKKVPYMQKIIPITFGVRRRTIILFKEKCESLGLNKDQVADVLMEDFIKKMKKNES
jgi:hypothetical protein